MSFSQFFKDKMIYNILIFFASATTYVLLLPFKMPIYIKAYIIVIPVIMYIISFTLEFIKKRAYYEKLKENLLNLNEKYLVAEIIENPNFEEGKIQKEILEETGKSMLENVNKYKYLQEDYKEFIELWIHEIKLPIATSKLIIENNKSKVTENINEELEKIENYIEQALYYARSNNVEKDYYIKKVNLKEIVNLSIIKNKRNLIQNKVIIEVKDIENMVYTDSKWCIFILNQVIQNAVKYSKKEDKKIEIYSKVEKECVNLYIKDNGIGIKEDEIKKVFEKGFTGENGRNSNQKSTGIGLYLSKKLCDKLGLKIELDSKKDIGTEIKITFPKSSFLSETI